MYCLQVLGVTDLRKWMKWSTLRLWPLVALKPVRLLYSEVR